MAFSLFGNGANAAPEEVFWKWFTKNEDRLFSFERNQNAVFDELGSAMRRINENLTFEFGPVENGKREFVISAGGVQAAFPAVELLYKKAPTLKRWTWVKFRPRRPTLYDINADGKKFSVEDVHFLLSEDGDRLGIVLFFDGFNENEKNRFAQVGFLFLDQALGEFAVEMQIGFIEFHSRESKYFAQASPLKDLQNQFDEYWAKVAH